MINTLPEIQCSEYSWKIQKGEEMKRLTVLILGCLMFVGVGLSVFTPGTIEAATITWKMQTTWPSGMGLHTSAVDLAKRIEEMSGGRLKIDIMPAGAIVPAFEVLSAIHKGTLDAGHSWSAYWIGILTTRLAETNILTFYQNTFLHHLLLIKRVYS